MMNRLFTTLFVTLSFSVSVFAVTVNDVAGEFNGSLNIGGTQYNGKTVYLLPGTASGTVTFVLPDFKYKNASLGDIVLVNIPMNTDGKLTLDNRSLYIKAISERAAISVLNDFKDGGESYNSVLSATNAQVLLSIAAPSLPEPILVLYAGNKVTDKNYALTNGGFEGSWSDNEPEGWHSFPSAVGDMASFVIGNTQQFQQSSVVRPGSSGKNSVLLQSNLILSEKANGNCTNGQINAGSTTADDPAKNYNFSDPSNSKHSTPFNGRPDSLVFWTKYIPADHKPGNSINKARAHAVVTTNTRYQDPESGNYSSARIADATINYSATSSMGWQRLAVPFSYTNVDPSKAAFILVTFTTNMQPGGGSTYKEGGGLFGGGTYYYDSVYVDDVSMVYNHALSSLQMNGSTISFSNGTAVSDKVFSDSDYDFAATPNGKAAKAFIGFNEAANKVYVYVIGDDYSQAKSYSLYTLQMAQPLKDTYYAYSATICANEQYSDGLFSNLTKADTYTATIPNKQGGDSVVTLTLSVLPAYDFPSSATINMDESYSWRGNDYANLTPGQYTFRDNHETKAGCDSVFTLNLTVKPIPYLIEESAVVCQNEESVWHNKLLPTSKSGTLVVYDSLKSVYGTDSVFVLTLTVNKSYLISKTMYTNEVDMTWRNQYISGLPMSDEPYLYYDSLTASNGCDSIYELVLYISDKPITYGEYQASVCEGDYITFNGNRYEESFDDEVRLSQPNIYGGDSVVHLVVTVLPSYFIEEYLTITIGDNLSWETFNLSTMPVGQISLNASYYSVDDCDSTMVLHLTVLPELIMDVNTPQSSTRVAQKIMYNGKLYIIREDGAIYDALGNKIN